ncbi:MAG: TIGR04282 family arsenosugar biosynthesis glycosyltransferase [Candidatus Eisenbacteria bacterium]|nr:TIGR04282 family arsenosugar biosynthesis glycosyltransferase [Candidatus Eisenbacteria bacterium]
MRRILVFARRPAPGRVKTRLSPALPADLACALYRGMLRDALDAAAGCAAGERLLYWDEPGGDEELPVPAGLAQRVQSGADLGERLTSAFAAALSAPGDRAVAIGADCPGLAADRLEAAFAGLQAHDAVLGPTGDGGYYLVGLARAAPALFAGVEWSTPRVLEQTLERARAAGLTMRTLGRLDDLDTPAGLARWVAGAAVAPPAHARHTLAALRGMGLLPPP